MSSNVKIYSPKLKEDSLIFKGSQILGSSVETKLDELKQELVAKIEKELSDSKNARFYISQKYDELCNKITFLTDLDATVTGFRADVKTIEKQISKLSTRIEDIERKSGYRDSHESSFLQKIE